MVLTGLDDESLATGALREGAEDYLIKGQIDPRGLLRALRYAIERKSMEDALFVEKERARVALNSIGDAVACTDVSGNMTFLNPLAERLTGWSSHEAVGRPIAEILQLLNGTSHESVPDPMGDEQDQTVHLPSKGMLVRRDGSETPIEDSVSPIQDRNGEFAGAVIVFRDLNAARPRRLHSTWVTRATPARA